MVKMNGLERTQSWSYGQRREGETLSLLLACKRGGGGGCGSSNFERSVLQCKVLAIDSELEGE